jgi:hypothetical protein
MKRIVQAHRLHHVVETKHGTVSFGFIWAPPIRQLKAQLEADGRGRTSDVPVDAGHRADGVGQLGRHGSGSQRHARHELQMSRHRATD